MRRATALGLCLAAIVSSALAADEATAAKTLFFDRKYAEARSAWQRVQLSSAPERESAAYYVARCSENLGELERALKEYGEYLAHRPSDSVLRDEARTSRVGLAAKLYKAGARQHLAILTDGLGDSSRQVRYYAAFQVAGLPGAEAQAAVPVLKEILGKESDADLVERAKVYLLRLDPKALAPADGPRAVRGASVSWLKIRVYEKGRSSPDVSVNLPAGLAELAFKSLPEDAKRELGRRGYVEGNFWERIRQLGPTQILDINDGDGGRVEIWTE